MEAIMLNRFAGSLNMQSLRRNCDWRTAIAVFWCMSAVAGFLTACVI
jgi:hypothetical protein